MANREKTVSQGSALKYVVRRSSAGLGLFAREAYARGEFVIEYIGWILTREEADEKGGKYLFETSKNRYIDGTTRQNIARYINHACKPNCRIEIERGHVRVYAKRAIKAGEELAYDYGEEYFDEFIKPAGCKCATCRT